jgi:hypothetical protein
VVPESEKCPSRPDFDVDAEVVDPGGGREGELIRHFSP